MKTPKTKQPPRDEHFPLNDAKLALDIAAIRDQISKLCADLRYDSRDKPQAVLTRLSDAQSVLGDALGVALTVEKSSTK
jgi:hypothetical protein